MSYGLVIKDEEEIVWQRRGEEKKCLWLFFFFFKQKTAYEMCGRDWSSDVCSSDLSKAVADIFFSLI